MLPFHKRARMSSSIEIDAEELEAVELPPVRPPSVRPGAYRHQEFASFDDEMTVVRVDKRVSTSPPPRASLPMPRIPQSFAPHVDGYDRAIARRYSDDEPTSLVPGATSQRPLLSMSSPSPRSVIVDERPRHVHHEVPPPPSRAVIAEPPRSVRAVDASASSDMAMTSSLSGSTDIRKLRRPSMGWATGLVAFGVIAGLVVAFASRGDGLSAIASLVDPSHVTADVAKASAAQPQQAPVALAAMPGAAVQPQQASAKPAAPSCNADAVAPAAKPEVKAEAAAPVAKVEPKVVVATVAPVAPPVVRPVVAVHHVQPVVRDTPRVAAADPPPATHTAARAARHHSGDGEMDSAAAADALAKAQLDAALTR